MNPSHFPSLDRCKRLTELGFPETECAWFKNKSIIATKKEMRFENRPVEMTQVGILKELVVCPSVMEMMDVIQSIPMREFKMRVMH
jgi:hypothetical protein